MTLEPKSDYDIVNYDYLIYLSVGAEHIEHVYMYMSIIYYKLIFKRVPLTYL